MSNCVGCQVLGSTQDTDEDILGGDLLPVSKCFVSLL